MLYLSLSLIFILGYIAIIFEKFLHVNKAAIALVMGVITWVVFFAIHPTKLDPSHALNDVTGNVAQIIFFLLAAMTIVELIDSHHGFKMITDIIYTSSKRRMIWFLILISFFMSAVLDNLTAMIVMVSLLRKLVPTKEDRWLFGSIVVIAVNAGGAWTPIGDVTTTLLWINNTITTWETIKMLFFPSITNIAVAGLASMLLIKGEHKPVSTKISHLPMEPGARRVLFMGILALVLIPFWKAVLGIPPFMGALLGLGILWLVTDIIHFRYGEDRWHLRVPHILAKIDTSGILFFLGILLAIDSLAEAGVLRDLAIFFEKVLPSQNVVAIILGLISSIVDNVPLVAATIGMYDLARFPVNSTLWQLIAYAAGTGGSILIIGSAAGVAFMGMEKVDFIWYLKRVSWLALLGYFAGFGVYFLQLLL